MMIPLTLLKKNDKKRIVAIGELLVEFIPTDPHGLLDEPGTMYKTASGSSGIFACAAAQLGWEIGFLGQLGKDKLSRFVMNIVSSQGVDISRIKIADEGQIGIGLVEYNEHGRSFQYYRSNSAGSRLDESGIDEEYIADSAAIHYPGMILELNDGIRNACIKAVRAAKDNGVIVSFDPNIRWEMIKGEGAVERLRWAVSQADIISPTLEEAKFITGKDDVKSVIESLHNMGPRLIAITRDENGAILSCNGEIADIPGVKVNAIDPTGAGDTFAAALLSGVLRGWELKKVGLFSNCAGALATTKQGTIGLALPSLKQVEDLMEKIWR